MRPDYKRLHDALDALPPRARRLANEGVWSEEAGCGCALGTALPKELWPSRNDLSFVDTLAGGTDAKREGLMSYGLTITPIREIEYANDAFVGTYVERFEYMLAWFKKKMEEVTP